MPEWVPLNWAILKHPANWVIIWVILILGGFLLHSLKQYHQS